jgi:hypothetical protein
LHRKAKTSSIAYLISTLECYPRPDALSMKCAKGMTDLACELAASSCLKSTWAVSGVLRLVGRPPCPRRSASSQQEQERQTQVKRDNTALVASTWDQEMYETSLGQASTIRLPN